MIVWSIDDLSLIDITGSTKPLPASLTHSYFLILHSCIAEYWADVIVYDIHDPRGVDVQ